MKTQIATTPEQSQRLIACGVDPMSADMRWREDMVGIGLSVGKWFPELANLNITPAWSLSALLVMIPLTIKFGKNEWWFDLAPVGADEQWSIGYFNSDRPRTIKGLTHKADIFECVVEEIEWLTQNGHTLNTTEK